MIASGSDFGLNQPMMRSMMPSPAAGAASAEAAGADAAGVVAGSGSLRGGGGASGVMPLTSGSSFFGAALASLRM